LLNTARRHIVYSTQQAVANDELSGIRAQFAGTTSLPATWEKAAALLTAGQHAIDIDAALRLAVAARRATADALALRAEATAAAEDAWTAGGEEEKTTASAAAAAAADKAEKRACAARAAAANAQRSGDVYGCSAKTLLSPGGGKKECCTPFWGDDLDAQNCPTCATPRIQDGHDTAKLLCRLLCVEDQIRLIYSRLSSHIKATASLRSTDGKLYSIYDSAEWDEIAFHYPEFGNDAGNLILRITTDGVCPFEHSSHSFWVVSFEILNLHPSLRRRPENLIKMLITYGPHQPENMQAVFQLVAAELQRAWRQGYHVYDPTLNVPPPPPSRQPAAAPPSPPAADHPAAAPPAAQPPTAQPPRPDGYRVVKCMLWRGIADGQALCKLCHRFSPAGSVGCPLCPFISTHSEEREHIFGEYWRWLPPDDKRRQSAAGPFRLRTDEEMYKQQEVIDELIKCNGPSGADEFKRQTGMHGLSAFHILDYWRTLKLEEKFIQIDLMHLLSNIGRAVILFLRTPEMSKYHKAITSRINSAASEKLSPTLAKVVTALASLGNKVNPSLKATHRVALLTSGILSFALAGIIPKKLYDVFAQLRSIASRLVSRVVTDSFISSLKADLISFLVDWECTMPTWMHTWQLHVLLHLPDQLSRDGPLPDSWCFMLESYYGVLVRSAHQMRYIERNIAREWMCRLGVMSAMRIFTPSLTQEDVDQRLTKKPLPGRRVCEGTWFSSPITVSDEAIDGAIFSNDVWLDESRAPVWDESEYQSRSLAYFKHANVFSMDMQVGTSTAFVAVFYGDRLLFGQVQGFVVATVCERVVPFACIQLLKETASFHTTTGMLCVSSLSLEWNPDAEQEVFIVEPLDTIVSQFSALRFSADLFLLLLSAPSPLTSHLLQSPSQPLRRFISQSMLGAAPPPSMTVAVPDDAWPLDAAAVAADQAAPADFDPNAHTFMDSPFDDEGDEGAEAGSGPPALVCSRCGQPVVADDVRDCTNGCCSADCCKAWCDDRRNWVDQRRADGEGRAQTKTQPYCGKAGHPKAVLRPRPPSPVREPEDPLALAAFLARKADLALDAARREEVSAAEEAQRVLAAKAEKVRRLEEASKRAAETAEGEAAKRAKVLKDGGLQPQPVAAAAAAGGGGDIDKEEARRARVRAVVDAAKSKASGGAAGGGEGAVTER